MCQLFSKQPPKLILLSTPGNQILKLSFLAQLMIYFLNWIISLWFLKIQTLGNAVLCLFYRSILIYQHFENFSIFNVFEN